MKTIEPHFHCYRCGKLLKKIHVIPASQLQEQTLYTCGEHFWIRFKISGEFKELRVDWGNSQ